VPQRTALSHSFGGLAAGLVGTAKYFYWLNHESEMLTAFRVTAIILEIILGYLTFTGSLIAAGKLQEVKWVPQRPWVYKGQNFVNLGAFVAAVLLGIFVILKPEHGASPVFFILIIVLAPSVLSFLRSGW